MLPALPECSEWDTAFWYVLGWSSQSRLLGRRYGGKTTSTLREGRGSTANQCGSERPSSQSWSSVADEALTHALVKR